MAAAGRRTIGVFGASNMDLIAYTSRFPAPGETIKGHKFQSGFGGKGANQAVAIANLGGEVYMVTKVGKDTFGVQTVENYKSKGVKTDYVFVDEELVTGCAPVLVRDDGENAIVIIGGANDAFTDADLASVSSHLLPLCSLFICQLEVPIHMNDILLRSARSLGVQTILNVAPAAPLPPSMLANTSILIANETEAFQILNESPVESENPLLRAEDAVLRLFQKAPFDCVVVTLGSKGCLAGLPVSDLYKDHPLKEGEWRHLHENICVFYVPAPKVEKVVDTTGAGDCFVGSFGFYLSEGKTVVQAVRAAAALASLSVQKMGTQSSYPSGLPDGFDF